MASEIRTTFSLLLQQSGLHTPPSVTPPIILSHPATLVLFIIILSCSLMRSYSQVANYFDWLIFDSLLRGSGTSPASTPPVRAFKPACGIKQHTPRSLSVPALPVLTLDVSIKLNLILSEGHQFWFYLKKLLGVSAWLTHAQSSPRGTLLYCTVSFKRTIVPVLLTGQRNCGSKNENCIVYSTPYHSTPVLFSSVKSQKEILGRMSKLFHIAEEDLYCQAL